eukprot:TRINITY_DN12725_c0_g1_i5.p2 TRINITY_DN12725_c0_g1~~TRINITY_DN12725_c0_g1_i5.p2  ORF type:complete len:108 (-),score=3.19 TRINITY_DN12725_c0_g1_i5:212-535(-)
MEMIIFFCNQIFYKIYLHINLNKCSHQKEDRVYNFLPFQPLELSESKFCSKGSNLKNSAGYFGQNVGKEIRFQNIMSTIKSNKLYFLKIVYLNSSQLLRRKQEALAL